MKHNFDITEFITALMIFLWGLWIAMPFDTFPSTSIGGLLDRIAPELFWGVTGTLLGGGWLLCAILGNKYRLRRFIVFGIILFWAIITISAITSNYKATATVIYPCILLIIANLYYKIVFTIYKKEKCNGRTKCTNS